MYDRVSYIYITYKYFKNDITEKTDHNKLLLYHADLNRVQELKLVVTLKFKGTIIKLFLLRNVANVLRQRETPLTQLKYNIKSNHY